MSTKTAVSNPRPVELELFQFTRPDFGAVAGHLKPVSRKNDAGKVVGLSLTIESRKIIAKDIKEPSKSSKVTDAILAASDSMKRAALQDVAQIVASPDWTGAGVRVSVAKNGTRRASFVFKTVNRGPVITKDELVKALAAMSDEEQNDILNMAVSMQQESAPAVEVPAIDNEKAELAQATAE